MGSDCHGKSRIREIKYGLLNLQRNVHGKIDDLNNVDCVPSNVQFSHQEAMLYLFEDNEAVIKIIIKAKKPYNETCFQTHRVAFDWLFDRINLDPKNPNQIH